MRTDLALNILKLILLGLLYLFFARVLWTVWQEVRTDRRVVPSHIANERSETRAGTGAQAARRRRRAGAAASARLVILEPKAAPRRHLRARPARSRSGAILAARCRSRATRSCRSATPAIYLVDGQPMVEDLGSTNGSFHNGNRLHGSRLLHPGDRVQVGYTVMEAQ